MLQKTKGIVFKFFKYGDTSIIVKIFTQQYGLQTYIVNGVRSKKSKNKIALFQPLTILDLVVYHNPNKEIKRISELKCSEPFQTMGSEMQKTAMAIFLAEIMYKAIKEEGDVSEIYEFLESSITLLDHLKKEYQNFHLQFLLKLSKYLGFGIDSSDPAFNSLDANERSKLLRLTSHPYDQWMPISNELRRKFLEAIIKFYKNHVESLGDINSVKILQEII